MTSTPNGSLIISDLSNNRVREISPLGIITTVAGTGVLGFSGDGQTATVAKLDAPTAVVLDPAGDLFIADSGNNRIRQVSASTGVIETITGNSTEAFAGDGGPANQASLYAPYGEYFAPNGDLYISDMLHNRVRMISGTSIELQYTTLKVGKLSEPQLVTVENAGDADLLVSAPIFDQSALDPGTTTCAVGAALSTTATCTLGVEFAPTVVASPDSGTLTQPSNAGNTPIVISLTGDVLAVEPTTISLASNNNPALIGSSVTFSSTVAAPDALTGTVNFLDGSTVICSTVALDPTNSASCTTSALKLGQHTITAVYSGDADNAAATSPQLIEQVKQDANPTLTVTPNPSIAGSTVTLKVTTAPPTGVATGNVVFFDGGTAIGAGTLNASGAATITTSTLSAGNHALTVQYAGDNLNLSQQSNIVNLVVQLATTSTTIATSNANVIVGTSITFSSHVVSTNGPPPTGTVAFMDGSTLLGTGTVGYLSGNTTTGNATFTTSTLAPGTHSITAVYSGDTYNGTSTSTILVQTVQQIGTLTTVSSDTNPTSAGATVHLTATVSIASGFTADGVLGGTVTFTSGATTLGTGTLNASGQVTIPVSSLNAGSDTIIASFGGSTNYATSSSVGLVEIVAQTSTMTALVDSSSTVAVGQSETFTATVTSPNGTPNGTVNFLEGAVLLGSQPVNASGVATFTTTSLAVGTQQITAVFVGNTNYLTSQNAVSVIVQQAMTSVALVSSVNPQSVGGSVTFTATLTSSDPNATGTVSFMDGATSLGSVAINAAGVAAFSSTTLAFGPHTITAVYSGDTNHATSTSTSLVQHIVQAAQMSLNSNVNPSVSGQSVTLSAKVVTVGGLVPTGTVVFTEGATTLGTGTMDGTGTASFAISTLAVGSHTITASYSGDANYSVATSMLVQTVQNASTQIALTASSNPAIYGTAVTLTAVISSNGSPATGTVTFTDGATTLGTGVLDGTGTANLTTSTLTPGLHTIVANYSGDGKAGASLSTPLALVVKEMTAVALTSSANPSATLSPVVFTAVVTNSGVGAPTGTITFTDGATTLGTVALDATGTATLTIATLTAGNHPIVATYSGDSDNFSGVSGTLTEGVTLRPTTTSLTGSADNPNDPQQVTLIAVVRGTTTIATNPTGTAVFTAGGVTIGSAPLDATGVATLNIELQSPSEVVVATYAGDTTFAGSASPATTVTGGLAAQFSVSVNPQSPTLASGDHTVLTLTLTSIKSFADTLQLGCLGLPQYATCTFTTPQVKLAAGGTVTTTVTVDTGDPLGSGALTGANRQPTFGSRRSEEVMFGFLPAGLLLGFGLFGKRRKKLVGLLVLVFAITLTLTATGCSGLKTQSTPAGTYTFTITAQGQGTGVSESQAVALTVTAK